MEKWASLDIKIVAVYSGQPHWSHVRMSHWNRALGCFLCHFHLCKVSVKLKVPDRGKPSLVLFQLSMLCAGSMWIPSLPHTPSNATSGCKGASKERGGAKARRKDKLPSVTQQQGVYRPAERGGKQELFLKPEKLNPRIGKEPFKQDDW